MIKNEGPSNHSIPEITDSSKKDSSKKGSAPSRSLLTSKIFVDFSDVGSDIGFNSGPSRRRRQRKIILWSCMAAFIDFLLMAGGTCLFLFCTGVLWRLLGQQEYFNLFFHGQFVIAFSAVFLIQYFTYLVGMRYLFSRTLGEWAYDIRIGHDYEKQHLGYLTRICLRALLMISSGGLVFPLLGLALGEDLIGRWTGVRLYRN